eukprot:1165523-Karenia_brevis.AAC.1
MTGLYGRNCAAEHFKMLRSLFFWQSQLARSQGRNISCRHVYGHDWHPWNELADGLASSAALSRYSSPYERCRLQRVAYCSNVEWMWLSVPG